MSSRPSWASGCSRLVCRIPLMNCPFDSSVMDSKRCSWWRRNDVLSNWRLKMYFMDYRKPVDPEWSVGVMRPVKKFLAELVNWGLMRLPLQLRLEFDHFISVTRCRHVWFSSRERRQNVAREARLASFGHRFSVLAVLTTLLREYLREVGPTAAWVVTSWRPTWHGTM